MLEELEEIVGTENDVFINSRKRIVNSISAAVVEIEKQLHAIVEGISDRVRIEVSDCPCHNHVMSFCQFELFRSE